MNKSQQTKFSLDKMKISIVSILALSVVSLGFTGYKSYANKLMAYDVYMGQEKVCTVRNQEDIDKVLGEITADLAHTYNVDVVLNNDLTMEETKAKDELISTEEEIKKEIKKRIDFSVYGYSLIVNGNEVGSLKTEEEFNEIIEKIEEPFKELVGEAELKEAKIVEDIEIVKKEMPLSQISDKEDIYEYLITSTEEVRTHELKAGENFWTVAIDYGLTMEELEKANPEKNPKKLQIGEEIKLVVPKPVLTVATAVEIEYIEKINYDTEYEFDDSMYKTEKRTKVAGVNGEKLVLANEIKFNGILTDKEVLSEEILSEPKTEIIVKGTKEPPKTVATGLFLMPTRGSITSRYGVRWGRMHSGIDIAAKTGTPINAADGGKVVYSGKRSGYGLMIEIDHGNGYKTRYAHCSKLLVGVGEKVYKGQHIANVGNTGNSTGPHLHFEVLQNGKTQNPSNYVK